MKWDASERRARRVARKASTGSDVVTRVASESRLRPVVNLPVDVFSLRVHARYDRVDGPHRFLSTMIRGKLTLLLGNVLARNEIFRETWYFRAFISVLVQTV